MRRAGVYTLILRSGRRSTRAADTDADAGVLFTQLRSEQRDIDKIDPARVVGMIWRRA